MYDYVCPKCGSRKIYPKPQGNRMGVYCSECNAWIAWTTYRNFKALYDELTDEDLPERMALRNMSNKNGIVMIKCGNCECLLFNSNEPRPKGQFDLVNAKYCPNCGKELL